MNALSTLINQVEKKLHAPILRMVGGKWSCSFLTRNHRGKMVPYAVHGFLTPANAYHCARGIWREYEREYDRSINYKGQA